ncbi:OB-fold domain-containing protein [Chelativorans sp. AA-79]|uniref:Zn-ribbon domain-containing OB-fold protein n=1 Tax=Chelativorans sp. AA-79 TaxID=3028735 RepID=UPI0023F856F3|nr:OB-fold domain-containing protein [Chelativorans sp. AA-79]WEX12444.1 OB-fold domain-containing protein [Chelativorans sp. AA-79]
MTGAAAKPAPIRDVWNGPFLDACKDRRLLLQCCLETKKFFYPPAPVSPYTGKRAWEWREASGQGSLWSFVVFHQNYFAGFADEIPYAVVMVELDEGPFLLTNLRGATASDLTIGQRVKVVFDEGETSLPHFAPET